MLEVRLDTMMKPLTLLSKKSPHILLMLSLMVNIYLLRQFKSDTLVPDSSKADPLPSSCVVTEGDKEELCGVTTPWFHVIKPTTETSLSNWKFNTTVKCPQFLIDQYPRPRQKVLLKCNGDKGRLVKTWTNLTRDVAVVEFGNKCLGSAIEKCCTGNQPVPNVIHYIWYTDKDMGFFHFLSLMSVLRFVRPCLFLIHGPFIPKGHYWDYFVSISPNIIHVKRERPTTIFGHDLAFMEHSSDIMRIEALINYGGIYLDYDEVVLRPLEPLRKYEYVQGRELEQTIGCQLIMAKKNARFLSHWYDKYRTDYRKTWAWNSLWVPEKLSREYPDLIHVEGYNFTRPNWKNAKQQIFIENYDWSTNYGMHLYARYFNGTINHKTIRHLNTTLGSVSRHIIFGNKELCTG